VCVIAIETMNVMRKIGDIDEKNKEPVTSVTKKAATRFI